MTSDTLRGHVVRCANEGVRIALGAEFTTDTKIAKFDLAIAAQENVGGFDVCKLLVNMFTFTVIVVPVPRWIIFRL